MQDYNPYINDDIYIQAQLHLCRALHVPYCQAKIGAGSDKVFSVSKALSLCVLRSPFGFVRSIPALIDYYTFKSHINYLHSHADRVRNSRNSEFADDIIDTACRIMLIEPSKHWSELSGLSAQKLAHLKYHEELSKTTFSSLLDNMMK